MAHGSASETREQPFTVDVTSSSLFRFSRRHHYSKYCTAEENLALFIRSHFSGTAPTNPQSCRLEVEARKSFSRSTARRIGTRSSKELRLMPRSFATTSFWLRARFSLYN